MYTTVVLNAEVARQELHERIARAGSPRMPAVAHRHLLAERLRRAADRIDN